MCLGIPGRVVEISRDEDCAVIETFGLKKKVCTALVEDVQVGEYLLVHAGYAIQKVSAEEARRSLFLWEGLAAGGGVE